MPARPPRPRFDDEDYVPDSDEEPSVSPSKSTPRSTRSRVSFGSSPATPSTPGTTPDKTKTPARSRVSGTPARTPATPSSSNRRRSVRLASKTGPPKTLQEFLEDPGEELRERVIEARRIVPGFPEDKKLTDHQVISRPKLVELENGPVNGGILADGMGLGKTIEMLALSVDNPATAEHLKRGGSKATLIIVPLSLLYQTHVAIAQFLPGKRSVIHHGQGRAYMASQLDGYDYVISTYELVLNEHTNWCEWQEMSEKMKKVSTKKRALFGVFWWRIMLDEGHIIKNPDIKRSEAVCVLNGAKHWVLSGTIVQNGVEDLFAIFRFIGLLDRWPTKADFHREIVTPLKNVFTEQVTMMILKTYLHDVMIRRTKLTLINGKPILKLPARIVQLVTCEFSPIERTIYNELMFKVNKEYGNILRKVGVEGRGWVYIQILVLILRLRQACNDAKLLPVEYQLLEEGEELTVRLDQEDGGEGREEDDNEDEDYEAASDEDDETDDSDEDGLAGDLRNLNVNKRDSRCQACGAGLRPTSTSPYCNACSEAIEDGIDPSTIISPNVDILDFKSSKTKMILDILEEKVYCAHPGDGIDAPQKAIIFSQWPTYLAMLEPHLIEKGYGYVSFHGKMSMVDRAEAVRAIMTDDDTRIILMSIKAGGVGLNLTACNHVILADMWWNPAIEDQCFDRAHRLGQQRDVHIYKLHVKDTIEDKILELQEKKRRLAMSIMSRQNIMFNNRLTLSQLKALFRGGAL